MSEEAVNKPSYEDLVRQNAELEHTLEETIRRCNAGTTALSIMAGVTHDIGNPLMVMATYGQFIRQILDNPEIDKEKIIEYTEIISKETQRIRKMANHILRSMRTTLGEEKELISVTEIIDECVYALEPSTPNIKYAKSYGDDIYKIEGDPNQLNQMMTNLLVNGARAMPDGGKLELRVNNYHGSAGKLGEGDYVSVEIHDHGMGIPEEHHEKIFEPFFTVGNFRQVGTGLGLAVVSAIVGKHQGYIYVSSNEEMGTTFNVFFPAYKE